MVRIKRLKRPQHSLIKTLLCCFIAACLTSACTQSIKTLTGQQKPTNIPQESDHHSLKQLVKTEFHRFADIEMRQNTRSLRKIMLKLYKRNPIELKKTRFDSAEAMVGFVFNEAKQHGYHFKSLKNLQQQHAITLAFEPHYEGDRVLAFIIGLQTMLLKAHGNKSEFYLTQELDPQVMYNFARNLEIAAWKLGHARNADGKLYLISNSMSQHIINLSIEREFGKMIGRTDLFAISLSEESQRTITRVIQNITSAIFLPL